MRGGTHYIREKSLQARKIHQVEDLLSGIGRFIANKPSEKESTTVVAFVIVSRNSLSLNSCVYDRESSRKTVKDDNYHYERPSVAEQMIKKDKRTAR